MFRKYVLLAASVLLTAVLHLSTAQADTARIVEKDAIPTKESISGIQRRTDTTHWNAIATNKPSISTQHNIITISEQFNPTVFPQRAEQPALVNAEIPSPGHDYTTQSVLMQEQMMMNLLNLDRKNNGLAPLTADEELNRLARIKSADMRDEGYFAHESPTYGNVRSMLKHFGYSYAAASENIAHHTNISKAQAAFMSSKGHRDNILSRTWTKVGIGIAFDAQGFIFATQIFAR